MPHTADCTLIIPVGSPDIDSTPRIALRLHTQHLSAKSIFLRGLFCGVSAIDLIQDLSVSCLHPSPIHCSIPQSHLPRLLPSSPSHPVLFLPVPDPSSIQSLFLWMYSGNTGHIETALDQGLIRWEGLVRNVEYLCLPTDIKVFLGRWYRDCLLPAQCLYRCPVDDDDDDDQSDLDSDCEDSDYEYSFPPSTDDEKCDRGRTRDIRPLEQLCGNLRLCAA